MKDARMVTLARQLVRYCVETKPGDRVLIENTGLSREFVAELVDQVYEAGGQPFVSIVDPLVQRSLLMHATDELLDTLAKYDAARMADMQCYIGVRSPENSYETSDVPASQLRRHASRYGKKVHTDIRIPKTRWVVLRYPTANMAQQAGLSTPAFEEHYFNVCNLDYAKMSQAMDAIVRRMEATDRVRIVGPGTDLSFSIKGMNAVKCDGKLNIPDGEIFTAPVKDSVNGTLYINAPSLYNGSTFSDIRLTFRDGKIAEATSSDTKRQNDILDTDEGARYVGEFAIGVNPYIHHAIKDTLFDEKIAGSFHFTPGSCYDEADNGNKSAIHWDLVCIQTPEYGGGEMYFDGVLVRKDGRFVTEDLLCLNPENLL